ncbi:protein kinase domain-containing protein [Pyxidicoccus sp. MSG2]|uniref:protein kinase domain-containing protein n=1 Tax=Pyxidicoccus sp. MSG2 TaxID=2996790 RepID=UPI00227183BE|nr:protein kinase [Pyxidicoccus sp. MSG2]MCY1014186.1 protein kinase [Pyxidicoccus sp. MSG2]
MSEPRHIPFGKYELQERLGSGGMAVVYRALYTAAPGVTKPVVIKRVLGTYAEDPAFVEMFLNEARISVGLSHGNIVQVFDFGKVDGEYFLAMELVDGHTLGRVLKAAKVKGLACLPAPLAVGIALEMCRGLHHAHTRLDARGEPLGVVHRDLSPDNVLLSYEGEVKLTDFGIAKARLKGRPETEVGIVKGKYLYFSPEQARGEALDARSDVYTVGSVLYQMLCGQRPADGSEFEVMRKISEGELTPALSLNPTLDSDLQGILRLALATSREKRYLSAEALQQSLSDWMGFRAPRFPANARKHFMGWLFQEELTALKRAPQIPADFLSQLQAWRGRSAAMPVQDGAPRSMTPMSPPRASPLGRPALAVDGVSATQVAKEAARPPVPPASASTPDAPGTGPTHANLRSRFRAHLLRRPAMVKGVLGALAVGIVSLVGTTVVRGAREEQRPDSPPVVATPPRSPEPSTATPSTATPGGATAATATPPTATGVEAMPTGATSATGTPSDAMPAGATTDTGTPSDAPPSTATAPDPAPGATEPSSPEDETRLALENGLYWTSRADDNRALGWFQQCLRFDKSQARCHLELARIYSRRGAIRDAMKHFTSHLALESEGPSADEARRYLKLYAGSDPP